MFWPAISYFQFHIFRTGHTYTPPIPVIQVQHSISLHPSDYYFTICAFESTLYISESSKYYLLHAHFLVQRTLNLLFYHYHPFVSLLDQCTWFGQIQTDGDCHICKVIFAEKRWDDIALTFGCHIVAMDQLFTLESFPYKGILQQKGRLDFGL